MLPIKTIHILDSSSCASSDDDIGVWDWLSSDGFFGIINRRSNVNVDRRLNDVVCWFMDGLRSRIDVDQVFWFMDGFSIRIGAGSG